MQAEDSITNTSNRYKIFRLIVFARFSTRHFTAAKQKRPAIIILFDSRFTRKYSEL